MTTILLVDDSATVLMFEKMLLSRMGFNLVTAKNGVEALKAIEQHTPSMVFLDLMMPELDGLECCKRIKADERFSHIPVIMVTTVSEQGKIAACREAGCDAYIFKPFNKLDLKKLIDKFLKPMKNN